MSTYADWQAIQQWTGDPLAQATANAIGAGTLDTGVLQVGSWASIILWAKATAKSVTAVVTQTIANGPAALTVSQTVVIAAGTQLATSIIMFGTQAEVVFTGGGVGCILDYAIVPSNTTTNAQLASGELNAAARIYEAFPTPTVIPNGAWTAIPLVSVDFATDAAMVATPSAITIVTPGIYAVAFAPLWSTQPTLYAQAAIYRNGLSIPSLAQTGAQVAGTNGSSPGYADMLLCSAGDVLTPRVYQQAGGQTGGGFMSAALVATL